MTVFVQEFNLRDAYKHVYDFDIVVINKARYLRMRQHDVNGYYVTERKIEYANKIIIELERG